MVHLHSIPGGKDDSEASECQPKQKPTVADMNKAGLPTETQKVLALKGRVLPVSEDAIDYHDPKRGRVVQGQGEIPQIITLRDIELRAMRVMRALAQKPKPNDSEK